MTVDFTSILFPGGRAAFRHEPRAAPDFFHDLNLDQLVDGVVAAWKEYNLAPLFHQPLHDTAAVAWRQEIMRDLQRTPVLQSIESFAERMRTARRHRMLSETLEYRYEKERWLLSAATIYAEAVEVLSREFGAIGLSSRGLRDFRDYLASYLASAAFVTLVDDARRRVADLAAVRYNLLVKDSSVTVLPYGGESDYTDAVEATFAKFRHGAVKDHRSAFSNPGRLNHVEAQILDRVALLEPEVFSALDAFAANHAEYVDETIGRFDREVQFYAAYLRYIDPLRAAGLPFCYPTMSATSKEVECRDGFDLALAARLAHDGVPVVRNDFRLKGRERIFVVTGPNHGGKTTFARMFGQLHYLAALGCPVPGSTARLFLGDRLLTYFEREEDPTTLRGKLQDDLVRLRTLLDRATPNSIVILNEVFASTTLEDAVALATKLMSDLSELDLLAVCVTFLDELASFDDTTVSLVSTVDPSDVATRTFRIVRQPADGLAYAVAIAEKYHVTREWLMRRIAAGPGGAA